jgi:hypothetical protein
MNGENEIVVHGQPRLSGSTSVTDEVGDFLERAEKIASSLNHPQLTAAHLILAITLTGYASDQFRKKFPEEGVYLACWHRLGELRPNKDGKGALAIDNDVREILTRAGQIASSRDPQNRATQVGDILQVLSETPAGSRLDEILRGKASITAADVFYGVRELREELADLTARLSRGEQELTRLFGEIAKWLRWLLVGIVVLAAAFLVVRSSL